MDKKMKDKNNGRDFDVEKWQKDWLFEKLELNRTAAIVIIAIISFMQAARYILFGKKENSFYWHIVIILSVALLSELYFRWYYSKTDSKIQRRYWCIGNIKDIPANVTVFKVFNKYAFYTNEIQYYPFSPLCIEAFLLTLLCAYSGSILSPYFALLICFGSLAEIVIDGPHFKIIFSFILIALLFPLIFELFPQSNFIFVAHPSEHLFTISISIIMTSKVITPLTERINDEMKEKLGYPKFQLETVFKKWHENELYKYNREIHGNYRLGVEKFSNIKPEDIIALIPYCLRNEHCPHRSEFKTTNDICDAPECKYHKNNKCDAGFAVNIFRNKKIYWKFISKGHKIASVLTAYKTDFGKKPYAVLGVSCITAFVNHAEKLLENNSVKEILYVKLRSGYGNCLSNLRSEIEIDYNDIARTTLDKQSLNYFMNSILTAKS